MLVMMKIAVPAVALLTINSHEALAAAKRVRGGGHNKAEVDYLAETISTSPSIYDHEAALLQLDNDKAKNKKKQQKQTRRGNNDQRRATSWSAATNPWLSPATATAATNNADLILDNTTVKMSKYKGKKRGGHGKKHRSDKQRKTSSSSSSSKSNKEAGWSPSSSTKSTWKSSSGGSSSSDSGSSSSSSKDEETIIVIGEKEESKSSSSSGWSKDAWDKPSSWGSPSWSGSSSTPSPSTSGKPVNDGPKKMWWGGPNAGWQDSPWGQTVWKTSSSSAEETVINNWVNTGETMIISGCSAFNTQTINGVLPPARPGEPPAPTPPAPTTGRATPQPPSLADSGPGGAPKIQQIRKFLSCLVFVCGQ